MKSRLVVAAVGLPLVLAVLCLAPVWGTAALFGAVSVIGVFELFRAVGLRDRALAQGLCVLSALAVHAAALLFGYYAALPLLLPFAVLLFLLWVAYYEKGAAFGFSGVAAALFCGYLVPLGLAAMTVLRLQDDGWILVLAPLVCTFVGDSGAYFAGRAFGTRKMAPRTSPNKTLAGLFGGLFAAGGGMLLYGLLLLGFDVPASLPRLLAVGLAGGAAAQLGDLAFSLIKREFGVKDYGKLLPGHGGAYDRFDSTSFAAPTVLALLILLRAAG